MSDINSYKKIIDDHILTAVDGFNGELSAGPLSLEIEQTSNLKNIVSRAIAQQRNETVYPDMVKEALGIYLKDQNNPSGHRPMVIAGFIADKLYIVDPGIDGTVIDFDSGQLTQNMIINSLKKCFNI